MKSVLIAGGAGFIGSHLCPYFLDQGFRVVCVDNLLTGEKQNIEPLLARPGFSFIQKDVTEPLDVPGDLDYVMHLASPASPVDYQKFPLETLQAGSRGTWNLLELAKKKGAVFLLASTSEVYGDPQVHPQTEGYWGNVNPVGPRSCYDEAKRYAESLAVSWRRKNGTPVRIARIFNTYGPRMRLNDGRALPNFVTQALRGKEVTVYGDGSQTRSFCFVEDMVKGLAALLFSREEGPVNLGNPAEISLLDFAGEVLRQTRSKSRIVFKPLPKDDPKVRKPDITKAKSALRWEPRVTLEEGLTKTIPYFAEVLKNA